MTVISRRTAVLGGASLLIVPLTARPVFAESRIGAPAPAFTCLDSNGKPLTLDDLKGKTVVLEWTNHECPFVRRHYTSDNMQSLQRRWTERGVIWLSIVSSAPGEEGNVTPEEANKLTVSRNAKPTAVLLDPQQAIAHAYGAKTTPHMFIIDPTGRLVYMGGIDDKPSTRIADNAEARNFVDAALTELAGGRPVSMPVTHSYGCSVKYTS